MADPNIAQRLYLMLPPLTEAGDWPQKLQAALGAGAGGAEQPVVLVETIEQRARDVEGAAVGELLREHRRHAGGAARPAQRCAAPR